jgi:hypothetical protein
MSDLGKDTLEVKKEVNDFTSSAAQTVSTNRSSFLKYINDDDIEEDGVALNYTLAGSTFVYGYLADTSLYEKPFLLADGSEYYLNPPFYFSILSVVFFSLPLFHC